MQIEITRFLPVFGRLVKTDAATAMSVFFLAMVLGRVSGSRFTRRVPGEKHLVAALLATITGFLFFWQAELAIINIAGLFLAGLGVANLYPLIVSLAVGVVPTQANLASARISLGAGLAIFSAPLILGWIADGHGIKTAYRIVPLLFLIAILMTLYANRRVTEPISE